MEKIGKRGVGCGIYSTNSAEATLYCLQAASVNIAVVDNNIQAQKILQYKHKFILDI